MVLLRQSHSQNPRAGGSRRGPWTPEGRPLDPRGEAPAQGSQPRDEAPALRANSPRGTTLLGGQWASGSTALPLSSRSRPFQSRGQCPGLSPTRPPGRQPLLRTGPYTHQPACHIHLASLTNSPREVRLSDQHVLYNTVTWRTCHFCQDPGRGSWRITPSPLSPPQPSLSLSFLN